MIKWLQKIFVPGLSMQIEAMNKQNELLEREIELTKELYAAERQLIEQEPDQKKKELMAISFMLDMMMRDIRSGRWM